MPDSAQIVQNLDQIARNWPRMAIVWHVYFGILLAALFAGRRPSNRAIALALTPPIASVTFMALASGNTFNGAVFVGILVCSSAIALQVSPSPVELSRRPLRITGALLLLFGWTYPHFIHAPAPLAYIYATPLGLLPCPTLSAAIGIGLLLSGFQSSSWMGLFGVVGLFYGMVGAARLGVWIDWALVFGALILTIALAFKKRLSDSSTVPRIHVSSVRES